jgi:DNA invertase Pin-like site-specific DNA recombinase
MDWAAPVSNDIAARRAGGRRHYNAMRQLRALLRRGEVSRLLEVAYTPTEIAQALGVSRITIWRDLHAISQAEPSPDCPRCRWYALLRRR